MDKYRVVELFYSHVRTYPAKADGSEWTTGERMEDVFRQVRKAAALLEVINYEILKADNIARAELKRELI